MQTKIILIAVLAVAVVVLAGVLGHKKLTQPTKTTPIAVEQVGWNTYSNPNVKFTFQYPQNWEIRVDYFYKESAVPTIVVCRKSEEKDVMVNCIQINMPQAPQGKREIRIEGNYVALYSEEPELLAVYDKLITTFKFIK